MSHYNLKVRAICWLLPVLAAALLVALPAGAAVPGITGPHFTLSAEAAYISQPDGASVYSWGYGCLGGSNSGGFLPAAIASPTCPSMQIPGPTLIVHEGDIVVVTLTNNLPGAAGNTSILFPGFDVCIGTIAVSGGPCTPSASGTNGVAGVLTQEAVHLGTVTYSFTASTPGTHAYYSGTQGDLQVEMGLYGAIIVLPSNTSIVSACTASGTLGGKNSAAHQFSGPPGQQGESDFTLSHAAYDHASTCYDREYIFQFSEMDPRIHQQAQDQASKSCSNTNGCMKVATEDYHPAYFMINGRSMPDLMDPNYASEYPHQPYNGDPHMHPGELVLLRVIGTGRWQHPFHEHGDHVRVLARDGNLIVSQTDPTKLAGPLLFTTTTTPGLTMDGIFYWTGKGLNWDVYGHGYAGDTAPCIADANGYYTADPSAPNYYEWCADHRKALEKAPFGNVASNGPVTLPDANYLTNGTWYGGSPYLGPDATVRATGPTGTTPPSGTVVNPPSSEAAFGFMWHSHNEREITTNNIFPGGMMMLMLVDPRAYAIDETK